MSVLIRGMEMPDRCFACPMCIKEDGEWLCNISHGPYLEYMEIPEDIAIDTRPDWCPLVELPPHGRLIDADALEDNVIAQKRSAIHAYEWTGKIGEWSARIGERERFAVMIEDAPTIIQAEEAQDHD